MTNETWFAEEVVTGRTGETVDVAVIGGWRSVVGAEQAHHNHVVVACGGDCCDGWRSGGGRSGGDGRETPHVVQGVVLECGGGSGEERVGGRLGVGEG